MQATLLRQWDTTHVWHPFTPMSAYATEEAPIIASGEGFYLTDTDGNRYLDGISALWCNVHGHRVPAIDQAIRDQLDQVAHSTLLGMGSVPSIELAHELVQIAPPGLRRVFYSDSGSTAVEAALKIAYQYYRQRPNPESRDLFVAMGDAYHGDTVGSVSVGGIDLFHEVYRGLLFQTLRVPAPVCYRVPAGTTPEEHLEWCYAEMERVVTENAGRIAAFVIEPLVQGAAGMLIHPSGYLKRVRELTKKHDILLIADEVAVGFGRTGTMFACEQEGVAPDLMCVAKGLTGGYLPVAATLATDAIFEAFLGDPSLGRTFFHGHTFTGNALGCAAGLASLKLFRENKVLENVGAISKLLTQRLSELADHPHVGEIRQKGTMVGIELVVDRETKEPYAGDLRLGHQVTLAARKRGVIIRPLGNVIVLMPAPAMQVDDINKLCDGAFAAIREVTDK